MKRYLVERELIQNNIQVLQKKAGSAVIWAVLKGNGYGLGLLPMAETCRAAGLDHFAVTEIAEARALREGGFETEPILMLQPTADADEITALLPLHVIFTISSTEDASVLAGLAAQAGVTAEAHIKIDTGMGRYGFLPEEMEKITPVYHYMDTIHVTGIYTHLHSAFCDKKATKAQIESFGRVLAALREAGIEPGMAHILNSSGVLHFSGAAMDAVRVGSALLGRVHGGHGLKRVGYCETQVEELKWLEEDEMLDITAITQSSPGPLPVNASVIIGYRMQGILGSLAAVLGTILPPMFVISLICVFYTEFRQNLYIAAALQVMRAGVAAVILDVTWNLAKNVWNSHSVFYTSLMVLSFCGAYFFGVSAMIIILICLVIGITEAVLTSYKKKGVTGNESFN